MPRVSSPQSSSTRPVRSEGRFLALPARRGWRRREARAGGVELVFIPDTRRDISGGLRHQRKLPSLTEDCAAPRGPIISMASPPSSPSCSCNARRTSRCSARRTTSSSSSSAAGARPQHPCARSSRGRSCASPTGSALSSRNGYLSPAERKTAPILHQVLSEAGAALANGVGCDAASSAGRFKLEGKGFRVDYVAIRDPETLAPLSGPIRRPARVMGAVHLGTTRLIDNVPTAPKNR